MSKMMCNAKNYENIIIRYGIIIKDIIIRFKYFSKISWKFSRSRNCAAVQKYAKMCTWANRSKPLFRFHWINFSVLHSISVRIHNFFSHQKKYSCLIIFLISSYKITITSTHTHFYALLFLSILFSLIFITRTAK